MSWKQRVHNIIDRYGVSVAEFIVLDEVRLRIPLVAHEFARFTISGCEGLDVDFNASDYEAAIDSCVQKGWLRILTVEDLENLTDVGTTYTFPHLSYRAYTEGSVDFTVAGYELTRSIVDELFASRREDGW
jgi:hypothetical protein